MPKVSPIQSSFSGGELDPFLYGRVDMDRYRQCLNVCLNYVPTIQGALTGRPGFKFVAEAGDDATDNTRLVRFEFSTTQAYILEFGYGGNSSGSYIRVFKDNAQVESSPGVPYEVTGLWADDQIPELKFTQSADVLYITHPNVAPAKLIRIDHNDWRIEYLTLIDGPYLTANTTEKDLTPSAATGTSVTITTGPAKTVNGATNLAGGIKISVTTNHNYKTGERVVISGVTGTTEANGTWTITVVDATSFRLDGSTFTNAYVSGGTVRPGLFTALDIGRWIRIKEGSTWGYALITGNTNASVITVEVKSTLTNTNAKTNWRLGAFGGHPQTGGYPSCVVFHEDRLFFSGVPREPQSVYGSTTGDYENFAPTELDGTVIPSNAVSFTLNSNDVNAVRWLVSDEKGLLGGTVAGEWVIRSSSTQEAISPTSISAKRATSYGSEDVSPVQAGKAAIFVQRAGRKARELTYFYDVDGYRATDLSILSNHLTNTGIKEFAAQRTPQPIVWAVRNDGVLLAMTYDRDLDTLKAGWSRHILGGTSDAEGTHAKVLSAAVIPSADGSRDELWVIVKRYIDGQTVRYIECMTKFFEDDDEQIDAFFVDSGLTYDNPLTITAITKANPAVVTSVAHGLSNGDQVIIRDVAGMTEINDRIFTIANITTDTFELRNAGDTADIDSSAYGTYISGGEARKRVSTITGLDHLEGESVTILCDGAAHANKTVSSGSITLDEPGTVVHIGLGYYMDGQLPTLEAGSEDGTALGKTRRTHRVGFYLYRSVNLLFGTNFDEMDRIELRSASDELDAAPTLFTGIMSETLESDYDFENRIAWRQDQPLPSTILAVMPQMVTQDRS